jgi:hypothetical protein
VIESRPRWCGWRLRSIPNRDSASMPSPVF